MLNYNVNSYSKVSKVIRNISRIKQHKIPTCFQICYKLADTKYKIAQTWFTKRSSNSNAPTIIMLKFVWNKKMYSHFSLKPPFFSHNKNPYKNQFNWLWNIGVLRTNNWGDLLQQQIAKTQYQNPDWGWPQPITNLNVNVLLKLERSFPCKWFFNMCQLAWFDAYTYMWTTIGNVSRCHNIMDITMLQTFMMKLNGNVPEYTSISAQRYKARYPLCSSSQNLSGVQVTKYFAITSIFQICFVCCAFFFFSCTKSI